MWIMLIKELFPIILLFFRHSLLIQIWLGHLRPLWSLLCILHGILLVNRIMALVMPSMELWRRGILSMMFMNYWKVRFWSIHIKVSKCWWLSRRTVLHCASLIGIYGLIMSRNVWLIWWRLSGNKLTHGSIGNFYCTMALARINTCIFLSMDKVEVFHSLGIWVVATNSLI